MKLLKVPCRKCGKETRSKGLGQEVKLCYLPILGRPCFLMIKPKRGICENCDDAPTTNQRVDWYEYKSRYTKAYESHVLFSLVNSTVTDISILKRNKEYVRKEERKILETLFQHSPALKAPHKLCCQLTGIYNSRIGKRKANKKMSEWVIKVEASELNCFNRFVRTLKKYKNEIVAYFKDRNTSGFVEGFNNKVKVLKRRCYGILTKTAYFDACF